MIEHGHIDINISKEDLDSLDFKDEVICYKQIPILEKYYNDSNSRIYELFHDDVPDWIEDIVNKLPQDWDYVYYSILKVPPGQTIPYHIDKHYKIQQKYGKAIDKIVRKKMAKLKSSEVSRVKKARDVKKAKKDA